MRPRLATTLAVAAVIAAAAPLEACDNSSSSHQASSDFKDAGDKAGEGLKDIGDAAKTQAGIAADKMQPTLDKAAADTKRSWDKLSVAAGKAAEKAGNSLVDAGDKAQAKAERDKAEHEERR